MSGDVAQTICGRLSNTAGVSAIFSTKIFPQNVPQNRTLPAVTFNEVTRTVAHSFGGDYGLYTSRMQVSSWSTSYSQAKALAIQVRKSLMDYKGSTWATVQRSFFDYEVDLMEIDNVTKEEVRHIAQDFIVWWTT
jgi:hypothetical protein